MGKLSRNPTRKTDAMLANALSQPPKASLSVCPTMVFRFTCGSAQNDATYTRAQVLSLLLQGTSTTTIGTRLIQAIRVNKLELWDPANGVTVSNHADLVWFGTQSLRKVMDHCTVGVSAAAHISTRPPKNSTASFVSMQGISESEILFGITCSPGAVLDIHASVTLASDWGIALTTVSVTGPVSQGVTYFNNLDGTGGNMRPALELNRIT
jgi:hypothetical protein